ncbi:AlpA family phage regulatory protein [Methylomonas paludis]|uniref:AlpA family phage regulatory protein n=1 Tax=Methylomonas paludis TaxID=1173101 RepID=A0A975MLR2_9GAMM|nr:AlpA family phage regulatory protein [Methylomonas paludis]QWF69656.1 AlpA family phage regulatory protein [Methylomonas paludis]
MSSKRDLLELSAQSAARKSRTKITYAAYPLPTEGFVRLPSVLAVLGVSKSSFLNGVKSGLYPAGKLLSSRCRVWSAAEIRALLDKIGGVK